MNVGMILAPGVTKKETGHSSHDNQYGPIPIIKEPDPFGPNTSNNASY